MNKIVRLTLLLVFIFSCLSQLSPEVLEKAKQTRLDILKWAPSRQDHGVTSILPAFCNETGVGCDGIFYNAISCSAGIEQFCGSVYYCQDDSGRFWRNIWHVGEMIKNSFSRDMTLAILLSLSYTHEREPFIKWLKYINETGFLCVDAEYNPNCEIRPLSYCTFQFVAEKMNLSQYMPPTSIIAPPVKPFWEQQTCKYWIELELLEVFSGRSDDVSGMNLIAIQLLTMKNFGYSWKSLRIIAEELHFKYPRHLFFKYLANGISNELVHEIIEAMPKEIPKRKHTWVWSHPYWKQGEWLNTSLGWDFYFLLTEIINNNI